MEVRCVNSGFTFRLFGERALAIGAANRLTSVHQLQFRTKAVRGTGGFVIVSADNRLMYDCAGSVPLRGIQLFRNCGVYLDWINKS